MTSPERGPRPRSGLRGVAWPVLRREVRALLRTRKAFWIAVATVAATGIVPLASWPRPGSALSYLTAGDCFVAYLSAFGVSLFVAVPLLTAPSVTVERERGTWDMLLATPWSPGAILLAKLFAAIAFVLGLLALTFPVAAVLYLLGGFEMSDFAASAAFLAVLAGCMALIGGYCSMGCRSSYLAITLASFFSLVLFCLIVLVIGFANAGRESWLSSLPFATLTIAALAAPYAVVLGRLPADSLEAAPPQVFVERPLPPRRPAPSEMSPVAWLLTRSREGIPDGWNPVLFAAVREGRRPLGDGRTLWVLVAFLLLLSQAGLFLVHASSIVRAAARIFLVLLVPLLASRTALGVAREIERGTLEDLRATPLRAREIVRGKVMGALVSEGAFLLLAAVFWIVFIPALLVEPGGWRALLAFPPGLAAASLLAAASGALGGALWGRTVPALITAIALAAGILLALFLLRVEVPLALIALGAAALLALEAAWLVLDRRRLRAR